MQRIVRPSIALLGVALFLWLHLLSLETTYPDQWRTLGFIALLACLWVSEIVPLGVASLLPLLYFPISGILGPEALGESYFNSTIFLFLGGFLLAGALERWGLHKRLALIILSATGRQVVAGFMIASAFLSMWISNTATAMMMLPIAGAVIGSLKGHGWTRPIYLGVAYGCSIGGIATIIGTPPNLAFSRIYRQSFGSESFPGFAEWILLALPLAAILLVLTYFVINRLLYRQGREETLGRHHWQAQLQEMGPLSKEERMVGILFGLTALLWIFRTPIDLEWFVIPGWISLFQWLPRPGMLNDGAVALFMASVCFLLPAPSNQSGGRILEKEDLDRIPWSILLLFGAGFSLAAAFESSELSRSVGLWLQNIRPDSVFLLMLAINLSMNLMTEFTSNTASAQVILPVIAALATQSGLPAFALMAGVTFSVSMAFMMPVATPPNAIVFGSGKLKIIDMVKAGLILNPLTALVVTIYCYFVLL